MFDDEPHTEERQLTRAVADLVAEFPDVPRPVIEGLIQEAVESYEAASVRTFLPILVTKDVRGRLRAYRPDVPAQGGQGVAEALTFELAAGG